MPQCLCWCRRSSRCRWSARNPWLSAWCGRSTPAALSWRALHHFLFREDHVIKDFIFALVEGGGETVESPRSRRIVSTLCKEFLTLGCVSKLFRRAPLQAAMSDNPHNVGWFAFLPKCICSSFCGQNTARAIPPPQFVRHSHCCHRLCWRLDPLEKHQVAWKEDLESPSLRI